MPQLYNEQTGKLIDAWIRCRRKIDNYQKSVTEYINIELAEKADLSGRQIERMRRYDGFPEDKSMSKLIKAIPDLKSLDCTDFVNRLLLPFPVVEMAQGRIKPPPKGEFNTIVIISSWIRPLGIQQNEIAQATTKNISGDFKYIFLYPDPLTYPEDDVPYNSGDRQYEDAVKNLTKEWIDDFRRKCEGIRNTEVLEKFKDRAKINSEFQASENLVKDRITIIHNNKSDNKFRSLLPSNYTVLYNPDKPKDSEFDRYGVFSVEGELIECWSEVLDNEDTGKNFINSSSGWLYINSKKFDELAELYFKIHLREKKY